MEENARQGFVNGIAPFGYRSIAAESRGAKLKKRLEIDPAEAEVVRLIFDLALRGVAGVQAMGVKQIAAELNRRGLLTRGGRRFTTKGVHEILRRSTYVGSHVFNQRDSRTKERKPTSKHVVVPVPSVVDEATFAAVQASLHARAPTQTAIRALNAPTLLSNLARCASCDGAMSLRTGTGKGGVVYRYYTCSTARRQGEAGCTGRSVREPLLDRLVTDHLCDVLFEPDWLRDRLEQVIEARRQAHHDGPRRVESLVAQQGDVGGRIHRLLSMVERGLMDLDDPQFASRRQALKDRRAELDREIAGLRSVAPSLPTVTPTKVARFSAELRAAVQTGEPAARSCACSSNGSK